MLIYKYVFLKSCFNLRADYINSNLLTYFRKANWQGGRKMNKIRYYYKIKRYQERKEALENLKVNVKLLLGLKKETMEEMNKRLESQKARLYLVFLIQDLLFEKNPYEEKQLIKNSQILTRWFEYYKININFVTKDEIDTLFIIMRKI